MGVKEAFGNVVRIVFMIDVLVMPAMLARPHQRRIFECRRSENQNHKPDWHSGAESHVGKQTMVTEGDAESGDEYQSRSYREVKPINAEKPNVNRQRGQAQDEGSDQERAGRPVDPVDRKAKRHRPKCSDRLWFYRSGRPKTTSFFAQ